MELSKEKPQKKIQLIFSNGMKNYTQIKLNEKKEAAVKLNLNLFLSFIVFIFQHYTNESS